MKHAGWSPDGRRLAGARIWNKVVSLFDLASGEEVSFSLDGDFDWHIVTRWSPDGRLLLLLTIDDRENYALWTVGVDGDGQQKILEQSAAISTPQWAPGASAVYYLSEAGFATDLMKLPVDSVTGAATREPEVVLSGLKAEAFNLSRDGRSILYQAINAHSNLILVDIQPGAPSPEFTPLTSGTLTHEFPSLSLDGSSVAFVRNGNIFVRNLADGETRQLTFKEAKRWSPVWSPTGSEIAFGSNEGGNPQIWRVRASGGAARPFAGSRPSQNGFTISWGPGSQIVYLKPGNRNVQLLDPESGTIRSLLEDEAEGWIFAPVASHDGKTLAAFRNTQGEGQGVWVFALESMAAKLILETDVGFPLRWSDDGASIYVREPNRILRLPVGGGQPEPFLEVPFAARWQGDPQGDLAANGTRAVFVEVEELSDLWLVENFDPDH